MDFKETLESVTKFRRNPDAEKKNRFIQQAILASVALKRDLTLEEIGMVYSDAFNARFQGYAVFDTNMPDSSDLREYRDMLLESGLFELKMSDSESNKVGLQSRTIGLIPLTTENERYLMQWVAKVSAERQKPIEVLYDIKKRDLCTAVDLGLIGLRVLPCFIEDDLSDVRKVTGLERDQKSLDKLVVKFSHPFPSGDSTTSSLAYDVVAAVDPREENSLRVSAQLSAKRPKI